ncbi:MAG: hypothetical protein ACYDB3_08090 [Acidimicrobiales bacterium]
MRKRRRLIVRRTRLVGRQATLWLQWRHFAFVSDLDGAVVAVVAFHRAHATVELPIRDLKEGAGLEHVPSGNFLANAGLLVCTALAHNLIPMDCHARRAHTRGPAHGGPHRAPPVLVRGGSPRQPIGPIDAARSAPVAVGRFL